MSSTVTTDLLDPWLDATCKGFPQGSAPVRRSAVGAQGWNILTGDLPLPLAVLKRAELSHNIGWMQHYANAAGISFAPHGKTSMSPQLFQRQLEAGAWGLTFATVNQARIGAEAGARRILIANQVLSAADLQGIVALRRDYAGLQLIFLLDSEAQLHAIETAAPGQDFEVLLELGHANGRTGCRDLATALALARAIHASQHLRLLGIECYEGLLAKGDDAADRAQARALMQQVSELAVLCEEQGLFDTSDIIISAGGSAIFDLVVPQLRLQLQRPVTGLLRSGCYVTHDHGFYKRMVGRVNHRLACDDGLRAALEVWALVQSQPEPGLAILAVGKRDISYDLDLPVPIAHCPREVLEVRAAPEGWRITGLNDQHAHLRWPEGAAVPAIGDRVALGISHPCTTFDKWRWMPIVDADYRVVDALITAF